MKTSSRSNSAANSNRTSAPVVARVDGPGRFLAAAAIAVGLAAAAAVPAHATDLHYNMLSPSFGGTNGIGLQMAQFDRSLKAARDAAAAAAAKAALPPDPNAPFVNAIISQLNGIVAQSIAQKIANSQPGSAGTVQSGNVTITYTNSDGQLSITITTPTGSTTLTVPSGG